MTTSLALESSILRVIELNPNLQPSTKAQYRKAILNYLTTGQDLVDTEALAIYAASLPPSSRSFLKAALKLWGEALALKVKASATPDNIANVQAILYRIEALMAAIKTESSKGQKVHTWLTQTEVRRLMETCNPETIQGKQRRVILGSLVGAGLRREELVNLTFDDMVLQPVAGKFRTVLSIKGKGAKDRAIPISDRLAAILEDWRVVAGVGQVARSVSRGGVIGGGLSAIAIFKIVQAAGALIGKELAPHDLRRTYAQLGYEAGISITQISKLLGHSNVATTQKYLNLDLDLTVTVSDFIPV